MRYFLDTEFMEDGRSVTLLSVGLVAESGHSYYAENAQAELGLANAFVRAQVLPKLRRMSRDCKTREQIRDDILSFVGRDVPEFWGYFCAYDWVIFTQLFGDFDRYGQLCKGWPLLCLDIEQLRRASPEIEMPPSPATAHHALSDAMWVRDAWIALQGVPLTVG